MYDTGGSYSVCDERTAQDHNLEARLSWLRAELAREERRRRLFRSAREEEQAQLMQDPIPTLEAFALLGMFLGLFPPAVLFFKLFRYGLSPRFGLGWFLLCLVMNVVCFAAGRAMGGRLGLRVDGLERRAWALTLAASVLLGLVWGVTTGGFGGIIFFGFGALAGAAFAAPVGAVAFALFVPLHRLLARGGMIEARHLWPLVYGVTGVIVALILSPHILK